eukprot:SAG11_NODE_11773_length_739_cov_0.823438_1_plen_166_part_10
MFVLPIDPSFADNCPIAAGSGWTLVRRTSGNTHQATDDLAGTDVYGTPSNDPLSGGSFSVNFEDTVPGWNEILLATGSCNHWMVMTKDAAIGEWYDGSQRQILRSHTSPSTPYTAGEYRRQGNNEDPWLCYTTRHDQATALYVEGNYPAARGNGQGAQNNGLNVYI